ncbi:MAG: hypothetical protein WC829_03495 [Hyphomicrobium sp.]
MASKFTSATVREAVDRSVRNAQHLRAIHSAPIAALQVLAERIDAPMNATDDDDSKAAQFDNVSIPTFLKYCQALGLMPDLKSEKQQTSPKANQTAPTSPAVRAVPSFRDVG